MFLHRVNNIENIEHDIKQNICTGIWGKSLLYLCDIDIAYKNSYSKRMMLLAK